MPKWLPETAQVCTLTLEGRACIASGTAERRIRIYVASKRKLVYLGIFQFLDAID